MSQQPYKEIKPAWERLSEEDRILYESLPSIMGSCKDHYIKGDNIRALRVLGVGYEIALYLEQITELGFFEGIKQRIPLSVSEVEEEFENGRAKGRFFLNLKSILEETLRH